MVLALVNMRLGKSLDTHPFLACLFHKVPANYFTFYKNKPLTGALFTISYPWIVASCHKCRKNSIRKKNGVFFEAFSTGRNNGRINDYTFCY